MDIVYPLRASSDCEEFRYSVRSISQNVPHRTVHVFGHVPSWFTGQGHYVPQPAAKHSNALANLRAAIDCPAVSDRFLLANDDMFAMRPTGWPIQNGCSLTEFHRTYKRQHPRSPYTAAIADTAALLKTVGIEDPVTWDLHVPFPVTKAELTDTLTLIADAFPDPDRRARIHWRTVYGNLNYPTTTATEDCKVYDRYLPAWALDSPWLSTTDHAFTVGQSGTLIRSTFPEPSPLENTETLAATG